VSGLLLGGALGVERDEAGDDLGRWQVGGPAVGFGDRRIDLLVESIDNGCTRLADAILLVRVASPNRWSSRKL